jgi:hypothetical protein
MFKKLPKTACDPKVQKMFALKNIILFFSKHTPPFSLQKKPLRASKLRFCHWITAHLVCIGGEEQCYGLPRNGLFEANHLVTVGFQSTSMLRRNCCVHRPRLKVIAIGVSYSD